jgi:hypothetical protein
VADGVETAVERAHPYAVLLAPGERLGWVFRDRTLFTRPFAEPAPVPDPVPAHVVDAARGVSDGLCTRSSMKEYTGVHGTRSAGRIGGSRRGQ